MNKKEQRKLDAERYAAGRGRVIAMLGGKCVVCDTDERLEIDHVNPADKELDISRHLMQTELPPEVLAEIKKCQLLCHKHHLEKSIRERGDLPAAGRHGTLSCYRICKCELCVKVHAEYCAEWKRKRKAAKKRKAARLRRKNRLEGDTN